MITETVLTDDQIKEIAGINEDNKNTWRASVDVDLARAIEQAVLQSPEVQRLRKKAERYDWLTRDAYITDCYTHQGTILEVAGTDRQVPIDDTVDAAIDAAMEKKPCQA